RWHAIALIGLFAAVFVTYQLRGHIVGELPYGLRLPVRIVVVAVLGGLGWALARDLGRALGPALMRRFDAATAGTVGFFIRLLTIVIVGLIALHVVGLNASSLLAGGAIGAVAIGLAAQQ